jgi:hypothetical protein
MHIITTTSNNKHATIHDATSEWEQRQQTVPLRSGLSTDVVAIAQEIIRNSPQ